MTTESKRLLYVAIVTFIIVFLTAVFNELMNVEIIRGYYSLNGMLIWLIINEVTKKM
jgi:hypothetical protein